MKKFFKLILKIPALLILCFIILMAFMVLPIPTLIVLSIIFIVKLWKFVF